MTGPRSFREAFTEDPADVKDRARIVEERDSARDWAVVLENRIEKALAEHERVGYGGDEDYCDTCVDTAGERALSWPCPSVAALTGGGDDARP